MRIELRDEPTYRAELVLQRAEELRAEYNEAVSIDAIYRKKRLAEALAREYGLSASAEALSFPPE